MLSTAAPALRIFDVVRGRECRTVVIEQQYMDPDRTTSGRRREPGARDLVPLAADGRATARARRFDSAFIPHLGATDVLGRPFMSTGADTPGTKKCRICGAVGGISRSRRPDSNRRPLHYEALGLPHTELALRRPFWRVIPHPIRALFRIYSVLSRGLRAHNQLCRRQGMDRAAQSGRHSASKRTAARLAPTRSPSCVASPSATSTRSASFGRGTSLRLAPSSSTPTKRGCASSRAPRTARWARS